MSALSPSHTPGGVDYGFFPATELNFTTIILASESEVPFGVFIRDDSIVERLESFTVSLYVPEQPTGGNVFLEGVDTVEVFVVDNDSEYVCVCCMFSEMNYVQLAMMMQWNSPIIIWTSWGH